MSSDDFEVQLTNPVRKWAAMKRISEAAADILVDQLGFDSMEAIALLTADDLQNCDMLCGQQKLVVQGVRNTFPSGNAALQDGCQDHVLLHRQLVRRINMLLKLFNSY